ncbi:myomegalin-like isoform X1 [Tigriopus californicus]|uniref:myomegalin-like isoform X1 n=1 Tax=Tigriopus californicus TaxID=6832 RepID=UPI0027DA7666|nr:myomegalin-like isoform X1 [Tigriopus californicus]
MYSPISPRKGLFGSIKNSPRKPLLSPSEGNPFSYSSETLNLFGTSDGFVPLSRNAIGGSGTFSQPRTPVSEHARPNSSWLPGKSISLGSGSIGAGSTTSINTSGRTVKEYDDGMRELKKENFNLKLRIYFLEERLGGGKVSSKESNGKQRPPASKQEDIAQSNMDLKIQVESLKYDLREKTELLKEAGLALEDLENRLSAMTIDREEERSTLEARLQQMEEDFQDTHDSIKDVFKEVKETQDNKERSLLSPDARDEDDKLLKEVDAEIARGLHFSPLRQVSSPASTSLMLPLSTEMLTSTPCRPTFLDVVQENEHEVMVGQVEELEKKVDELQLELHNSELTLKEAKEVVDQRMNDIISLESELVNRDIQISALQGELSQVKGESGEASTVQVEELNLLLRERDEAAEKLRHSEEELGHLKKSIVGLGDELDDHKEKFEALKLELEIKQNRIEELETALGNANDTIDCLNMEQQGAGGSTVTSRSLGCPTTSDDARFTIHTHQLSDLLDQTAFNHATSENVYGTQLQVVTQTLHIPPTSNAYGGHEFSSQPQESDEVERLRRDMAKLKEYLRTSVQERKLLLKKIGTLNERIAQVQKNKLVVLQNGYPVPASDLAKSFPKSVSIQCNLGSKGIEELAGPSSPRSLNLRIANLQQRLVRSSEDAEALRAYLESLVDVIEPLTRQPGSKLSPDLVLGIKRAVLDSLEMVKSHSRVPTPLIRDTTASIGGGDEDEIDAFRPASATSGNSWRSVLPDPSHLDLGKFEQNLKCDVSVDSNHSGRLRQDLDEKTAMLELLEEQLDEKDQMMLEQERMLDEYRLEILRLQEANECEQEFSVSYDHRRGGTSSDKSRSLRRNRLSISSQRRRGPPTSGVYTQSQHSELEIKNAARALSDGEDSWSEPDVTAARRRMGLSTQALRARMADKDSSETDFDKQKSFYSLEYTRAEMSEDGDQTVTTFEDYSKIIEELQSHRREIEKLQVTSTSLDDEPPNCLTLVAKPSLEFEGYPREHQDAPGSLECILTGIGDLLAAMNDLSYQLDLSDSFSDSGHGSDEEEDEDGDDTEVENSFCKEEIHFRLCTQCSVVVCQDVEHCLERCGKLILASISTMRRLRKICCHSRSRLHQASEKMAKQNNQIAQLEETVKLLQKKTEITEKLQSDLDNTRSDLGKKAKELQDAHLKLNENYKLVAELSNENLRLISEKVKVEDLNETLQKDHSRLRAELRDNRKLHPINNIKHYNKPDTNASQEANKPWNIPLTGASSPETSSSFEFFEPTIATSSSGMPTTPTIARRCISGQLDVSLGARHRSFDRITVSSRPKITHHTGRRVKPPSSPHPLDQEPPFQRSYSTSESKRSYTSGTTKVHPSDLSSPDLGVDVGSDPFSSLERNQSSLDNVRGGNKVPIDTMLVENRQLRHERDLLLQKLVRSKGALKETLDRLTTSNQQKQDHLSPQTQRRVLSSSSVLQSIGASPSRSRITQDLLEFSRTHHGGGSPRSSPHNPSMGSPKKPKSRRNSNMS